MAVLFHFLRLNSLFFLLVLSLGAFAQKATLYGTVTDSTSRPLIGAYIIADGKTGVIRTSA